MPLVVLDIDGTLTQTVGVDDSAFLRAFDEALGLRGFDADWNNYPHATDSSLAEEIVRRTRGTAPMPSELAGLQERYFAILREQAAVPGAILATRGARELLVALNRRGGWGAALATGGWREAALIKLTAAGMLVVGVPAAFADDALSRADIVRLAMARAVPYAWRPGEDADELMLIARERFGGIVCVGDGPWDARTARELGLGFVGLCPRGDDRRLRALGASAVINSFVPLDGTLEVLAAAAGGR